MKLKNLLAGIRPLSCTADLAQEIAGVSCSSQKIQPGEVYVAIPGTQTDGMRYAAQAMSQGASCVICRAIPQMDVPYVQVRSPRQALALMARNFFGDPASDITLIGVTGTNGKTTTTYLIRHILETVLHTKVGLIGTIQNMMGQQVTEASRTTPDAWQMHKMLRAMADAGCTHAVMEVSSHALALDRVYGLHFAVGVFTNLTQDHLDFHDCMADYCDMKALLFDDCDAAVFNADDPWHARLVRAAPQNRLSYGIENGMLQAQDITITASKTTYTAVTETEQLTVEIPIPGMFTVYNTLSAMGACRMLGVPLRESAEALRSCTGVKGRMEVVPAPGKDYTVIIDYAHTPDALENVLAAVRRLARGRTIAVFGCGGDRDRSKRAQMGAIAARYADFSIITDDNPRTENPQKIREDIIAGVPDTACWREVPGRVEAIRYALTQAETGDVIVLCGKGHETYQEIGHEKRHMDEREIVAEYMKNNK